MTVWALRSLPATKIRWNKSAWMCHTLISTWKRHHFCRSPIQLLPKWSCFRTGKVLMKPHGSLKWFLPDTSMRRWTFRTSNRSSSGGWPRRHENIEKHFRFCVTEIFLVKKTIFVYHFLSCRSMFFEISTAWSASNASEHSMVLPVTLYELFCQVAIGKVRFAPKERLARASR